MAKKVKPDKEKPTPSTTSEQRLLRFDDLRARGIVSNWMTLARWIQNEDFPPGLRLGGRLRAWRAVDIESWLASRALSTRPEAASAHHKSPPA
jgi:predicted DNA-binding transcriptional regulator AlpA